MPIFAQTYKQHFPPFSLSPIHIHTLRSAASLTKGFSHNSTLRSSRSDSSLRNALTSASNSGTWPTLFHHSFGYSTRVCTVCMYFQIDFLHQIDAHILSALPQILFWASQVIFVLFFGVVCQWNGMKECGKNWTEKECAVE